VWTQPPDTTPETPTDSEIQRILDNIQSSSNITAARRNACKAAAQVMLEKGFAPAFVAGMLANVCKEGNTGQFESSAYTTNPEPDYLVYMDKNYNYRSEYSSKYIYNKNVNTVYDILTTLKTSSNNTWKINGSRVGFGLGSVQWTFIRTYTLVGMYLEVNGQNNAITIDQAIQAECEMIAYELKDGDFKSVYVDWQKDNAANLNSQTAVYNAGYTICAKYEKPGGGATAANTRGNLAKLIYADIMK
jgi:hypothetical protein